MHRENLLMSTRMRDTRDKSDPWDTLAGHLEQAPLPVRERRKKTLIPNGQSYYGPGNVGPGRSGRQLGVMTTLRAEFAAAFLNTS